MSDFSLEGKIAIITGGSRGIGRSIALGYANAGADVVIVSRTQEDVERVAEEAEAFGARSLGLPVDVTNSTSVRQMTEKILDTFGRIDVLVNNAGISPVYTNVLKVKEEDWDRIIDVNLKAPFLCCQAVGRAMVEQNEGKVINIASVGATTGLPKFIAYCASKGGLVQITRVLASEWATNNIQVNAIAPGYVETDMTSGLDETPWLKEDIIQRTPMERLAQPDEVVGAAIFLASQASSYITGHILYVDGGWSAA
ncbi:MAG: glucose 1-dehydrogenase [Chloroflexi bacterium]|nr:glucose 1-dehydrogenase [Chloroflexota bacterium]